MCATQQQVEVLQVSSLEDFAWPDEDPHSVPQKTRPRCAKDLDLIQRCIQPASLNIDKYLANARREGRSLEQQVLGILAHQKFQMNPAKKVREENAWLEAVGKAMAAKKPVEVVYPQFCVIPNAPKRYTNIGTAAGEDCTLEFFKHINAQVQTIYPPGVVFHALADASLYASAFQTHQTEVDAYYESLKSRIAELSAGRCVKLYDYSELLRTRCYPDYQRLYYTIGQEVWTGNIDELLPNTDIPTLRRSVRCSINTRRFQLSHAEHRELFGPMKDRNTNHPLYATIEQMTDIALNEVTTIRLACGEIDIASRLWQNALRATCHKGQKHGRWAIGLRPYPEYYGSCKLLPYHGMPLISLDRKGCPKLEIKPEVLLRSRSDLVRVTSDGGDEVYAYLTQDVEKMVEEMLGQGLQYKAPKGMRESEFNDADSGE